MGNGYLTSVVPKERLIDDLPQQELCLWGLRLFALINLSWDYIDTILQVCSNHRMDETKRLARRVRELKREYDQFRICGPVDGSFEKAETRHGLIIEEIYEGDFDRLFASLTLEADRRKLTGGGRELFIAVHQALALMDAVRMYARWCDRQMASHGVWQTDCCMVQQQFLDLFPLIPQFLPGVLRNPAFHETSARIIANRLHTFGEPIGGGKYVFKRL